MERCIFFSSVEKTILLMFLQGRGQQWEGRERKGRRREEGELGVYVQYLYYRVLITSTNDNTQCTQ